jgi:hypothetical protein
VPGPTRVRRSLSSRDNMALSSLQFLFDRFSAARRGVRYEEFLWAKTASKKVNLLGK